MPDWISFSGYASTSDGILFSAGGFHYDNSVPGPTRWVYTDKIYHMDMKEVAVLFFSLRRFKIVMFFSTIFV